MIAWIIYNGDGATYNRQYIQFYIEEGAKLGIDVRLILVEELEFGVKNGHLFVSYQNQKITEPDFAISRVIYPLLNKHLELMGIRVFNNSFVSEICNDKARTYQYLAKTGIPMVDSSFYRNDQLKEVLSKAETNTVIKAVDGHGGSQVFLKSADSGREMKASEERERIINGINSSDIVVQPLTGNRHQDLRVYVIGKEIIAAVLRTAKEGFRSNYSLGGDVRLYELSMEETAIIKIIMDQFEFGLVGIDFIIGDKGELIFNEIEDVVGSRMLYQCSDINVVERYLGFIINKL